TAPFDGDPRPHVSAPRAKIVPAAQRWLSPISQTSQPSWVAKNTSTASAVKTVAVKSFLLSMVITSPSPASVQQGVASALNPGMWWRRSWCRALTAARGTRSSSGPSHRGTRTTRTSSASLTSTGGEGVGGRLREYMGLQVPGPAESRRDAARPFECLTMAPPLLFDLPRWSPSLGAASSGAAPIFSADKYGPAAFPQPVRSPTPMPAG